MGQSTDETIHMPYGNGRGIDITVDSSRFVGVFRAPKAHQLLSERVLDTLTAPLDYPPLEQAVIPDDRVTLVIENRLPGMGEILGSVWKRLAARGVAPEHVTIMQRLPVTGESSVEDPRWHLPAAVRGKVQWRMHAPPAEADGTLHYLATTANAERIYLAEDLVHADVVVAIGMMGFDPLMGYRGTHSLFFPGFSSREAARRAQGQGHRELAPEDARPFRQLVDEVGWLLGANFTVQVIPAGQGGVADVLSGASESVLRIGRELLTNWWQFELVERVDTVVVAVDDLGEGGGWAEIATALSLASRLVVRDGRIILLTDVKEVVGDGFEIIRRVDQPGDAAAILREVMPTDFGEAMEFVSVHDWARVYVLSNLDDDVVDDLFCVPVADGEEINRLLRQAQESCFFVESGQFAYGRIR